MKQSRLVLRQYTYQCHLWEYQDVVCQTYKGCRIVPLYLRLLLYRLFTAPSSRGTMVSMFTLLSSLLLVSAVLAVPSSLAEASGFTRGHEDPQSPPINHVASRADAASYALMRAGAVLPQNNVCMIPMVHDHVQSHSLPTG